MYKVLKHFFSLDNFFNEFQCKIKIFNGKYFFPLEQYELTEMSFNTQV